ncbi:MAG: phage terminase large subunit [Proteobacteria bacterium]|nr:phage terminase large subunit [Pseudomonadota bacterium]
MGISLKNKIDKLEPLILARSGKLEKTVYGVVSDVEKIDGKLKPVFIRKWKGRIGHMVETDEQPTIWIVEKLEPLILKHKKVKGVFGGRAGTKSIMAMDAMIGEVNSCGVGVFCLRERMKSISQSIYKGINGRVKALDFAGFNPVESKWKIDHKNGGIISFGGLMNVEDMKSLFEYKYFFLEESAKTSQLALDTLGPTLRGVDGAEQWMIWNPLSSNDPMSLEFITPYQAYFDRQGYYEDDYHLIIKVGFEDNPFFKHDKSLVEEFEKDTQKMNDGRMSKARYNHIWYGAFNDDVENSAIEPDWFDACIDAHIKLGFEGSGAKVAAHDPSDTGGDEKGYAARHGVVFEFMEELEGGNANEAFDVACKRANEYGADVFGWDADGMGALLRNQAAVNFKGMKIQTYMYKGSESVHNPEAQFSYSENYNIQQGKKNKDVFKNKKAQNIISFAERCRRTWEAVTLDKYHDPDTLVSFKTYNEKDKTGIKPDMMAKLRSEACRTPIKPSDKICFYTKQELRSGIQQKDGKKLVIPSPNLFDAAVLSFDNACIINHINTSAVMPRPLQTMGRR